MFQCHYAIVTQLTWRHRVTFHQIHVGQYSVIRSQSIDHSLIFPGCKHFFPWLSTVFYFFNFVVFPSPSSVPFLVPDFVGTVSSVLVWARIHFFLPS